MHTLSPLLRRAEALDSAALSDALDALGLPSGVPGLLPSTTGDRVIGFAVTATVEPFVPEALGPHLLTEVVASAGQADVLVIDNAGRTDVSCWGGILGLGAHARGVRGVLIEGVCRDVEENRRIGLSVYSRGSSPRTARGRLRQRAHGETVTISGRSVSHGDLVLHDDTGFVVVPRDALDRVLREAERIVAREARIADEVRAGRPLPDVMHDARLSRTDDDR